MGLSENGGDSTPRSQGGHFKRNHQFGVDDFQMVNFAVARCFHPTFITGYDFLVCQGAYPFGIFGQPARVFGRHIYILHDLHVVQRGAHKKYRLNWAKNIWTASGSGVGSFFRFSDGAIEVSIFLFPLQKFPHRSFQVSGSSPRDVAKQLRDNSMVFKGAAAQLETRPLIG